MTKVECLKILCEKLTGSKSKGETVCEVLHDMGSKCNENVYSSDEIDTGKVWINGKHIYRKVVNSTVGNIQTDLNALNADTVVSFYGQALSNYGNWFTIPYNSGLISGGNVYAIDCIQSNLAHRNFQITFGEYYNAENGAYIVIEYTKKDD